MDELIRRNDILLVYHSQTLLISNRNKYDNTSFVYSEKCFADLARILNVTGKTYRGFLYLIEKQSVLYGIYGSDIRTISTGKFKNRYQFFIRNVTGLNLDERYKDTFLLN